MAPDDEDLVATTAQTRPRTLGLPFTHWSIRKLAAYLAEHPIRLGYPRPSTPEHGDSVTETPGGFRDGRQLSRGWMVS